MLWFVKVWLNAQNEMQSCLRCFLYMILKVYLDMLDNEYVCQKMNFSRMVLFSDECPTQILNIKQPSLLSLILFQCMYFYCSADWLIIVVLMCTMVFFAEF